MWTAIVLHPGRKTSCFEDPCCHGLLQEELPHSTDVGLHPKELYGLLDAPFGDVQGLCQVPLACGGTGLNLHLQIGQELGCQLLVVPPGARLPGEVSPGVFMLLDVGDKPATAANDAADVIRLSSGVEKIGHPLPFGLHLLSILS